MTAIIDHIRRHSDLRPEASAVIHLADGETAAADFGYGALWNRITSYASLLRELAPPESRVVLTLPAGVDAIVAFLASMAAGLVPVISPPLRLRDPRPWQRLESIVHDCNPALIIASPDSMASVGRLAGQGSQVLSAQWIAGPPPTTSPCNGQPLSAPLSDIAFLQYTSGSTAEPKGVVVTQENLSANLDVIGQKFGVDEETIAVSWLPLHHDMGLVGVVLAALRHRARLVLMSPLHFVQKPVRWLAAISRFSATHSGGPNFAYDLCVRRAASSAGNLDLSSWRKAFCGAEPVRKETLDRFSASFSCAGFKAASFYPCYGLAEATLFAAGANQVRPPLHRKFDPEALSRSNPVAVSSSAGREIISCGTAAAGHDIAIVDPTTRSLLASGQVGEVWLRGPSISAGYWRNEKDTAAVFSASTDAGESGFLRTGDLGFFHDGELFIAGRLKDVIIANGRKIFPHDVEQSVERIVTDASIGAAAAFESGDIHEARFTVLLEVADLRSESADALMGLIVRAVAQDHEASPKRVALVRTGALPRTTSGKLQRAAARDLVRSNKLPLLAERHW